MFYSYDFGTLPAGDVGVTDGTDATTTTYTTIPTDTGYILSDRRGTTDVWYHTNAIGTINNLTNAQEGVILTVESDAFGNIQSQTGTTPDNQRHMVQMVS